jgi:protein gp37
MNKTNIPWADYTWNPITGCTNGCEYCYARKLTERFPAAYPNGFAPTFHPDRLSEPAKVKKPSTIFVGSMGDLFDPEFLDSQQFDILYKICASYTWHTYMLLTKQASRMHRFFSGGVVPDNLWLGVTATNQREYESKVLPLLRDVHANIFVSIEPMLSEIDLLDFLGIKRPSLVIVGSKTPGPPLHVAHPDWLDHVIDDCDKAGIPVHYKHSGTNPEYRGRVYDWRPGR